MIDQLQEQIRIVARARQISEQAKKEWEEAYEIWKSAHMHLSTNRDLVLVSQNEAEDKLRKLTIEIFNQTGNKTPTPGVGIREITKLTYEPKEALKWAMEHQIALSLDKKSFEGFARATPLDFVKITQEPQAIIATDLSKYLEVKQK